MVTKNTKKERFAGRLDLSVSKILITNDNNLKPFIELFEFAPENVNQQPLGKLLGIFEVKDNEDESAYIVNFLTSVAKKEYYINNKRPVIDGFESTLHKINIALSELAKNGNVKWIGKLDAVVCTLEKNIIHFSVSGEAKVLLLRDQSLTDISEGLASQDLEPYPLKTFVNVSSGKLEPDDKLIITTGDIFHIFSLPEIKKGALHFDKEKFVQFINTALVNELEIAGTIILDVSFFPQEEEEIIEEQPKKKRDYLNAFSGTAFKKAPQMPSISPASEELKETEKQDEYTDDKTGHIYVHGEYQKTKESGFWSLFWFTISEKMSELLYWLKENVLKKGWQKIKEGFIALGKGVSFTKSKIVARMTEKKRRIAETKEREEIFSPDGKLPDFKVQESANYDHRNKVLSGLKIFFFLIKKFFPKILPNFSRIKERLNIMSYSERIYVLLIIIAILIVPFLWTKITSEKPAPLPQPEIQTQVSRSQELMNDKNINLNPQLLISSLDEEALQPLIIRDQLIIVSAKKVINFNNGEEKKFALPDNAGNVISATSMNDLGLIFLLTDASKIFSFSPITSDFKENNLEFPPNAKISGLSTYLTYIYLVDSQNNKIYRYPRAEGGFGANISWLKDNLDLKNTSGIAIDENVYLVDGGQILKLFKGAKQEFNPESSATPINFNKVFTDSETSSLYVLDIGNGRLVKFAKTGEIISQYYSPEIEKAVNFTADEKNNKAYFITSDNNLITMEL
jgi:hypothetical protein